MQCESIRAFENHVKHDHKAKTYHNEDVELNQLVQTIYRGIMKIGKGLTEGQSLRLKCTSEGQSFVKNAP